MNRRQLAVGVAATSVGLGLFVVLALTGVLGHLRVPTDPAHPAEFLAIGSGFLLVTGGIVTTFLAYIELPDPDPDPDG